MLRSVFLYSYAIILSVGFAMPASAQNDNSGRGPSAEMDILRFSKLPSQEGNRDWSGALKLALAAPPGTQITFPPGTFLINSDKYEAAAGVSLVGSRAGRTIFKINPQSCWQKTGNITWKNSSNISVRNITFDLSGCAPREPHAPFLNFVRDQNVLVENDVFENVGVHWNIVAINGTQHVIVRNNSASVEPSTNLNHFVSLTTSGGPVSDVVIQNNTSHGSGILVAGNDVRVISNDISGWEYGGGVTVTRGLTPNVIVANNNIHDSGRGADSDKTYANGIEAWSKGAIIFNNFIRNVGASCVFSGGNDQKIIKNTCVGAGKGLRQAGFVAGFVTKENSAEGSIYADNRAESDASKSMPYGFSAVRGNRSIIFDNNSFSGAEGEEHNEATNIQYKACFESNRAITMESVEQLKLSPDCSR